MYTSLFLKQQSDLCAGRSIHDLANTLLMVKGEGLDKETVFYIRMDVMQVFTKLSAVVISSRASTNSTYLLGVNEIAVIFAAVKL